MYVVAIAELSATIDTEAGALADDLGVTAYEARLLLASGTPSIVCTTRDKPRALHLLSRLRARGHGAIACDAAAVVPSAAMPCMRRFRLGERSISLDDRRGASLPYADVVALVAAVHRRRTVHEAEGRHRELAIGRAVLTGGVVTTRAVKRETRAATDEREPVLYVFCVGQAPWLLRERGTSWAGSGLPVAPSASDNFRVTVAALRERMARAAYDERLLVRKSAPERLAVAVESGATTTTTSSERGVDMLAHLVAMWVSRAR